MSELSGLYAIWYREFKVFTREKSRVFYAITTPIMWLFLFGVGLGSSVDIKGFNYQTYIFPGILAQAVIFSSIFFGTYIIWDKKIDFLKEVLVAPLRRTTIFFGKVLGGLTDSLVQGVVLLMLGGVIGLVHLTLFSVLTVLLFLLLLSIGLVSVGLIIGSFMESPEGFGLIISFVVLPLFFLSGALYPIDNLPSWLLVFTRLDPVTYAVDGLRGALIGVSIFPVGLSIAILLLFSVVSVLAGVEAFKRLKL